MERRTKRVRIVGKGHTSCFSSLLREWFLMSRFVDVTLTCNSSESIDTWRHIQANRSVLAAASSVFATLFNESLLVEEDLQVILVGYDYEIVKNIVEYIYTGSIEFAFSENEKIESFLKDFKIKLPEVTRNYELEDVTDITGDLTEFIIPDFPSGQNQNVESFVPNPVTAHNLLSTFDITSKGNQETFLTKEHPTQVSSILAKNSSQRSSKHLTKNTGATITKQIQNPTLKHRSTYSACNTNHNSNLLPAGVVVFELEPSTEAVQNIVLERNRGLSTPVTGRASTAKHTPPLKHYVNKSVTNKQSTTPVTYKVLHRTISAPINKKEAVTLEVPSKQGQFGLFKSFLEKTIQQPGNVFNQLLKPEVTEKAKSATEEAARVKNYRTMISAFYDVPGTYTLYRERPVYVVDSYYAPLEMIGDHVYCPSFLKNQTQLRTYQERPLVRSEKWTLRNLSLLGVRIDSIHQVGNQVHIRTIGEPKVDKESESLFNDSPSLSRNPLQVANQLFEHNYSFGETELKENESIEVESNSKELEEDIEDYKRALQLTINEQRRKNRLKMRIQSQEKEIKMLRKRARNLIKFCHDLNEEAHDIDPEFFEKTRDLIESSDLAEPLPKKGRTEPDSKPNPMIPCEVCNKSIKESWMKRHLLIAHSAERNWMCDECGRTFVLKGQLKAHQKRQHEIQPGNYLCEECGRSFRFVRYLKRHMSLHRNEKPHVCRYCDKAFRLKPVLIKHIRTHTGEKPYECTVCGKCFRQRTTYANHLKVHEKRREAVQNNGAVLGATNAPERLKCDFCSMTFRLDLFMMLHRSKHTGEIPALPCPTCSMTFPSIKELSLHRKNNHPDTVYACKICPKIFTNKANFDFHVQRHSNPDLKRKKYGTIDTSGPATCEFCNKVFSSRSGLDYHIKGIHLGEKSMKCQFCDKTFSHRPTMEQHMRIHTGERPFKCDQCPSAFKQNQHLAAHMVIHTGERPFACEHCDKSFPHKTTLYTHMRIHTGNRLLCTYCSKVLPSLAQLQRHEDECAMNEINQ